MTKTIVDPTLMLVQQLSELRIMLRAVDATDNQGEPCEHCQDQRRANGVTLYGTDKDGEHSTADCCVQCIPVVVFEHFNQNHTILAEVAR